MPLVETRCFQRLTQLVLIAGFGIALSISQTSFAQEAETTLEELQQQWKDLDGQLVSKEKQLKSGEGDSAEIQKQYQELVDQANELVKQLETAAKSKLETEPDNPDVVRTLMGIMLNDAQFGRDSKVLAMGDLLISHGINPEYFEIASRAERLSIPSREIFDELILRHAEAMSADLPRVKMTTTKGDIVLELFENEAPNTVGNFISLVEKGYYTDMLFHRVIEGFMAQGGGFKLEGDEEVGGKGPGYEIKCECFTPDHRLHFANSLSMAHRGKDTGGSQFFITFERTDFLDGRHTCFGRVIEGQDVLDTLARTHISGPQGEEPIPGITKDQILKAEVIRKREHKYRPDKAGGNDEDEEELKQENQPAKKEEKKPEANQKDKDESKPDADEDEKAKPDDPKEESDDKDPAEPQEKSTDDSKSETDSDKKSEADGDQPKSDENDKQ